MIKLNTKKDIFINVPENISEDKTPRFNILKVNDALKYYLDHGYVIFSKCISVNDYNDILRLWDTEIKSYKGKFLDKQLVEQKKHI